jgi:hypothetical protein
MLAICILSFEDYLDLLPILNKAFFCC